MYNKIALLIPLLLFLYACQQVEVPENERLVTLQFRSDGIEQVSTKADIVNLPAERTVRVVVYISEGGASASDLDRRYVTTNTYEVQSDGSLRPCQVDSLGRVTEGEAFEIQVPVFDGATKYLDFYAYSPAIPLKEDNKTAIVKNDMDFMTTAMYGVPITQSDTDIAITLPAMKRLCTAIKFEYIYNNDGVKLEMAKGKEYLTNRAYGLNIDNLYQSGTYTLGTTDIAINKSLIGTYYAPEDVITNPALPTLDPNKLGGIIYLLPGAADNLQANNTFNFKFDINFSITTPLSMASQAQVVSYPACDGLLLEKGKMTKLNMLVTYIGPGPTLMVITARSIDAWEEADTILFPL